MVKNKISSILAFDFVINTLLTIVELVAGSISGSIALLADGFQNLTDSIVLTIAYIATRLTNRGGLRKRDRTLIYKITGCMNAAILITLSIYIGFNAIHRLLNPQPINTKLVIAVGLLSITVNWLAAGLLYKSRNENNIRAPYIGLLFSGFSGLGVFASGVITQYLHIKNLDAIVGLAIAFVLLIRSINLFSKAISDR